MISKEDKAEFNELIEILDSKYNYPYVDMLERIKQYINQPTLLDTEVEEALKIVLNLKIPTYEDATFTPLEYKNAFNTIRQAFINMQEEIALLKRDVANNKTIRKEAIRLGKKRLQSKINDYERLIVEIYAQAPQDEETRKLIDEFDKKQILGDKKDTDKIWTEKEIKFMEKIAKLKSQSKLDKENKHIKTYNVKDLTIYEYHKKYAKNNYFIVERGIERLGIIKTVYGIYRFYPKNDIDINYFDLKTLGEFIYKLQKGDKK